MSFVNRSRRIGERLAVQGIVLGWDTRGRRSPRRIRPFAEADIIDVSVSGAQLLAPDNARIDVGHQVTIAAGGALGVVKVKRIVPVANGQLAVFGVEFVKLEAPLEAMLFSRFDATRPPSDSVDWY